MAVPIFWLTCAACSLAVLIASVSLLSRAFFTSASASRTSDLMSSGTFSSFSPSNFSVWYTTQSAAVPARAPPRAFAFPLVVFSRAPALLLVSVLGRRGPAGDLHRLLLARAQVLGGHVHDAVGVDVEGDLDLRHAAGRGRDAGQLEH